MTPIRKRLSLVLALSVALGIFALMSVSLTPSGTLHIVATAQAEKEEHGAPAPKKKAKSTKKKSVKKEKPKASEVEDLTHEEPKAIGNGDGFDSADFDAQLADTKTIDAVILLDTSGSMQRTDPGKLRVQAAKLFVRFLSEGDRVALIEFDRDARQKIDLTPVTPESVAAFDDVVGQTGDTGTHTDLEGAVVSAYELLKEKGGSKSTKAVVLLSDGQMDPPTEHGTPEALIERSMAEDLPKYRALGIRLYTLAFSDEADKPLLSDMAKATDGLGWHAQDANSIHVKFSDLFLALKKPQVSPLEAGGFEIDSSVREATFYITRKDSVKEIALVSPKGEAYTSTEFPPGTKWYRGELFDVVTISKPLAGSWQVRGLEDPEGFATLLTDLQVQLRWPQSNLKVGDTIAFFARLTSKGEVFHEEALKDLIFYQFKILNLKTGRTAASGSMNDRGEDGDEKAGDGIFSAKAKIDIEGDYRALVGVTAPTFTRQQQVPFSVSKGLVSLVLEPGDEFSGTKPRFVIQLGHEASKLKETEVKLAAELVGEGTVSGYKPTPVAGEEGAYEFSPEKLPAGNYKISVRVHGKDPKTKTEVNGVSDTLDYTAVGTGEAGETEEVAESGDSSWILGLVCLLLSILWSGGLIYYEKKKLNFSKGLPEREKRYVRSSAIASDLASIGGRASSNRRPPTDEDFVTFELVRELLGSAAPKSPEPADHGDGSTEEAAS